MQWFRIWHDMVSDPKWRVISRHSKRPVNEVISVAICLMTSASEGDERGAYSVEPEDIAACLDMEETDVEAIIAAMQGRFLNGSAIVNWEKRQPKKEDGAAERARAWRERQKTQPNATERTETPRVDVDVDTDNLSTVEKPFEETTTATKSFRPNGSFFTLGEWSSAHDMKEVPDAWLATAGVAAKPLGLSKAQIAQKAERFWKHYNGGKGKAYTSDNWPGMFWTWIKEEPRRKAA